MLLARVNILPTELPEIALVGRSNVGKSSLINALVNRRKLARTSGQPGRTQTLNFYRVDRIVLVDLSRVWIAQGTGTGPPKLAGDD